MNNELITFLHLSNEIGQAMADLANSMAKAGKLIVQAIDLFPDAMPQLRKKFPAVPLRMWTTLEKVGRGVMDNRVALGCPHSFLLQRLPLSDQRRALDESIDLVLTNGDTCKIKVQDSTSTQARQLIGDSNLRSIEQQAAWLRGQIAPPPKSKSAILAYELRPKKGEVEFIARGPASLTLSKNDLLDILRRLG